MAASPRLAVALAAGQAGSSCALGCACQTASCRSHRPFQPQHLSYSTVNSFRDQGNRRNQLTFMRRQAELIAGAQGVKLPKEFIAAAAAGGLRQGALQQYLKLQV